MEPPQNQTVSVNSVAIFTCIATSFVVWQIGSAQLSSQLISTSQVVKNFRMQGITLDSENGSVLLVNATLRNDGIKIRCLTGPLLNVMSETAVLMVFGE